MLGGGEHDALGRVVAISGMPMQRNPVAIPSEIPSASGSQKKDDRIPQWTPQETRNFIAIRAEMERDFTVSKRNKTLWEFVAAKMRERGYRRTPDQCKCKWKNLVNRYKGIESTDPENGKQFPFFDEVHAVFNERAMNMQRVMVESEAGEGQAKRRSKQPCGDRTSDELSEEEDEEEDDSEEERMARPRKRKAERERQRATMADKGKASSIHELLQDFLQQQQRMEMQWRDMMDRRSQERRIFEQEWRQTMEKLERDRLMMEQAWREREEQRRLREENRAEKRDVLITTLLNKLLHEEL